VHGRETYNALNASVCCEQKRLQRLSKTVSFKRSLDKLQTQTTKNNTSLGWTTLLKKLVWYPRQRHYYFYDMIMLFRTKSPLPHWDVMLVWKKGNINRTDSAAVSCIIIMVHNDTSSSCRSVDWILLGLALYLPSVFVSGLHGAISPGELSLVGLALQCYL